MDSIGMDSIGGGVQLVESMDLDAIDDTFGEGIESEDEFGFFPLIAGAIGLISTIASGAAAGATLVAGTISVVKELGGKGEIAKLVKGGVKTADALIRAAKGGDKKALGRLKGIAAQKAALERREKGVEVLARIMLDARRGNPKAQATIAGLQTLSDPKVTRAMAIGGFSHTFGKLPKFVRPFGVDTSVKEMIRLASERARRDPRWKLPPKKQAFPVATMKKAAVAAVKAKVKTQLKTAKPGARGFLVLPNGRIVNGRWSPN